MLNERPDEGDRSAWAHGSFKLADPSHSLHYEAPPADATCGPSPPGSPRRPSAAAAAGAAAAGGGGGGGGGSPLPAAAAAPHTPPADAQRVWVERVLVGEGAP